MLEIIIGTDWVANRDEILRMVSQEVQQCRSGIVVMVPELISHDMERRLCVAAGDTASRYAEILPFSRLANRISESVGHAALSCMDDGGRVVAMAAATRQLHSKLKAYASVETKPEFLFNMVDAVDEFKRCCITPRDLMLASRQSEGAFAQKLEELSLLFETYDSLCIHGKRDPRDQMNWVLEQLETSDYAKDRVFYIDGFPDFTRQNFAVLEHFICNAPKVTVSLNCDKPGSHSLAFEKAGATASALIRVAQRAGVAYTVRSVETTQASMAEIRSQLFQGNISKGSVFRDQLAITAADSAYGEIQNAAMRVQQLVRNGARYRDISIVYTDGNTYEDLLGLVFNRCGIPLYRSGKEDILQKPLMSTVLSAIDAALNGLDRQDVLQYLKSPFSPVDFDSADKLENYAIMWGITGSRWTSPWEYNPEGLSGEMTEDACKQLSLLEETRKKVLAPLVRLQQGFRNAGKLDDQITALLDFLDDISLCDRLEELAEALDAEGDNRSAQILNQLWDILLNALEQLRDVLGDTVWDGESFFHLLKLLLSQYDVGTIPPVLDAVTAGPANAMRCHQADHQIILGAREGAFPGYSGSNGILNDHERDALRAMGVGLTGGGMEGLQEAFAEIYGVFCAARKSIAVSYSGNQPSYVYRRLLEMVGEETPAEPYLSPDATDLAVSLIQSKDLKTAKQLGLETVCDRVLKRAQHQLGKISRQNVEKLYGKSLRLSASQIDRQAECRFSYFLNYGLRAKERKEITVDPAEFGTYVHAVLEHTAAEVMELGGFHKVSLEQTAEIAKRHSQIYAQQRFSQLDSKRISYLFHRNMQELDAVVAELWKELHVSFFQPKKFELGFGDGKEMDCIDISGSTMGAVLRGFVDRVDIWEDAEHTYFRVVDYKTGSKDFDYCDVFHGVGLQMLLYMFALEENGGEALAEQRIPAGVQYFPARSPITASSGKVSAEAAEKLHADSLKRKGLVLAQENVLDAMEPEGAPKRLSCKRGKDGSWQGDMASAEQLKQLREYIFRHLRNLVDEIASGAVEPNPYTRGIQHGICSWCPYKSVCHYLYVGERRNYKSMTAQRFWEEIGKELSHHG